jgi:predicted RNA binding protein YcfA (HicA-like mRNA interferase family)
MGKLIPITPKDFEKFLKYAGCEFKRQSGSHRIYTRSGLIRPIIVPFHSGDLPIFVIKNNLRLLNISVDDYLAILEKI